MDFRIQIPDWEIDRIAREEIAKEVKSRVDLVSVKDVATAVLIRLEDYLRKGTSSIEDSGPIAQMLDKRIGEMIGNIEDEFLKNALLDRLVRKMG